MNKGDKPEAPAEATEDNPRLKARREFVSRFGKAAATAPAITLLLSAGSKRAIAGLGSPGGD